VSRFFIFDRMSFAYPYIRPFAS
jgi:hypothetical protein